MYEISRALTIPNIWLFVQEGILKESFLFSYLKDPFTRLLASSVESFRLQGQSVDCNMLSASPTMGSNKLEDLFDPIEKRLSSSSQLDGVNHSECGLSLAARKPDQSYPHLNAIYVIAVITILGNIGMFRLICSTKKSRNQVKIFFWNHGCSLFQLYIQCPDDCLEREHVHDGHRCVWRPPHALLLLSQYLLQPPHP